MLKLAPIFSDNMVLQRDKKITLWGRTDRSEVTVSLGGNVAKKEVTGNSFSVELPPMAAGGPYEMKVQAGAEEITYKDVMIGEVWLAGGQSNMELELQNSFEGAKELAACEKENVRYYQIPKFAFESEESLRAEEESAWAKASEENAKAWSAVAYYFAKDLSKKLDVTVGIIGCNWGGTSASAWMSREALLESNKTSSYIEEYDAIVKEQDYDAYVKEREEYIIYQTEFEKNVSHYYETSENPTWDEAISLFGENKYPGPMGPLSEFRPSGLYENMLMKVCPYGLKGFIYYQGEEDDHKPETYYELLTALIRQWRTDWDDESLPFLLVQLPVFQNMGEPDYKNWPLIREAQMRVAQTIRNTGVAVILEHGEYGNIHPTRKDIVGERLVLQAYYQVYHMITAEEAFGPVFEQAYTEKDKFHLCFRYAKGGFVEKGEVKGFEVAGEDCVYYPADYSLAQEEIILSSSEVTSPVYGRYCWTNYQEIALFGANGMPVAPFRTSRRDGSVVTGSRLSNEGVM